MGWPFFIYNNELFNKKNKQDQERKRKDTFNNLLKEHPNFYLDSYDLDKIWNEDIVMKILNSIPKKSIPVYKIELDKKYKDSNGIDYWTTKKVFVGYKDI